MDELTVTAFAGASFHEASRLQPTYQFTPGPVAHYITERWVSKPAPCHSGTCCAKKAGESDERLFAVAAWRYAPCFTDAERAAVALAEAVTRLSDRADPGPDEIWGEAARHYDEQALAAWILSIATTNVFNRLNVTIRQVAGARG